MYGFFHQSLTEAQVQVLSQRPLSLCQSSLHVFKDEPRARVTLIQWQGQEYILKFYNVKSPFFRLRRLLGASLAWQKWQLVQGVKKCTIPTPELLASVDVGKRLLYQGTLCLYEYVKPDWGCVELKDAFSQKGQRGVIIDAVVDLLCRMHQAGIYHGDAKISNFLWLEDSGTISLQVIDLDGVCFERDVSDRQRLSDLATLTTSLVWWENDPDLISQCFGSYVGNYSPWGRNGEVVYEKLQNQVARRLEKRKKTWKP